MEEEEIIYNIDHKKLLVVELQTRYICLICARLMFSPIQTVRGCSACEKCYSLACEKSFNENGTCPIDNEPILNCNQYFHDRAVRKEILSLKCYCLNKDTGCNWIGIVKSLLVRLFC